MTPRARCPKRTAKPAIAMALTWDGARWPVRHLPAAARAFLGGASPARGRATPAHLSRRLEAKEITELRVCWVPRLKGGPDVLCPPFVTPAGLRIGFVAAKWKRFGEILGVIYHLRPAGDRRSAQEQP